MRLFLATVFLTILTQPVLASLDLRFNFAHPPEPVKPSQCLEALENGTSFHEDDSQRYVIFEGMIYRFESFAWFDQRLSIRCEIQKP